ncbi:hypothetical protein SKAU_G00300490 [Synaphobranchus kaupii]|uniref:Uncharacterized protein n=1 Tax=Synaphobranchus kaupii TaxID=118154 RepID=A0A9Q1EVN2_SYNKA|nr:hypothetical protein SKAU_G00300490 [Synaphobranchus kaupii]
MCTLCCVNTLLDDLVEVIRCADIYRALCRACYRDVILVAEKDNSAPKREETPSRSFLGRLPSCVPLVGYSSPYCKHELRPRDHF